VLTTTEMTAAMPADETRPVGSSDQFALSETDCSRLYLFIHSGQQSARARIRAQVLLKLGEGWSLSEVCRAFDVCRNTVAAVGLFSQTAGWMQCCATNGKPATVKRSAARSRRTS
jgi:Homeodomain-like domain